MSEKPQADSVAGLAPYPGSKGIPRWDLGELPDAPTFTWKNWIGMVGPGLLMGGLAIGGGEWLMGPIITAKFGGGLLWLALFSLLGQLIYNIEISRYALYTGEPIFTGKFRTLPGPMFWVGVYVLLDLGTLFPYVASASATPLVALVTGELPDPIKDEALLRNVAIGVLVVSMIPLVIGGKIYNGLKLLMAFKLFTILGFLFVVALLYSTRSTWSEIVAGFVQVGNVPVLKGEDLNGDGVLNEGEDWDGDGHLDVVEEKYAMDLDTDNDGKNDDWSDRNNDGKKDKFNDVDGDGIRDGSRTENVFAALLEGRFPAIDTTMIAFLCALVAISGGGGLGNSPISNYTRDQGWGMGAHVGAIPTFIGGHQYQLSHVGMVFEVNEESLPRWKRWYNHVRRDQLFVWFPACVFGVALPAMLSLQFLPRGFEVDNQWLASVMTADAIRDHVGDRWGYFFWFMTVFCGFLVLGFSVAPATDGFIRRWIDVFWTASGSMRKLDPKSIRYVYFGLLAAYTIWSAVILYISKPTTLLLIAGLFMNFAMGATMLHSLFVNSLLLPRELRPNWFSRLCLFLAAMFFFAVATISTWITVQEKFVNV